MSSPWTNERRVSWADAALVQAAGIPTLMTGPKGGNFHAADEWVDLPDVVRFTDLPRETAARFLDGPR